MPIALLVLVVVVVLVVGLACWQTRSYRQAMHRERDTAFIDSRRSRAR